MRKRNRETEKLSYFVAIFRYYEKVLFFYFSNLQLIGFFNCKIFELIKKKKKIKIFNFQFFFFFCERENETYIIFIISNSHDFVGSIRRRSIITRRRASERESSRLAARSLMLLGRSNTTRRLAGATTLASSRVCIYSRKPVFNVRSLNEGPV